MAPVTAGGLSLVVGALYAVALFAPAIKADEGGRACTAIRLGTLPGWETLVFGWVPPLTIPWSANLLLLLGWILLLRARYRPAMRLGVAAMLAGLTTLALWPLEGWETLRVGYYFWQASLFVFAWGSWRLWRRYGESKREGPRVLPSHDGG
jgi:hypothetical protein